MLWKKSLNVGIKLLSFTNFINFLSKYDLALYYSFYYIWPDQGEIFHKLFYTLKKSGGICFLFSIQSTLNNP